MEIEEIIFSNNLLLYDKHALNIKKFILKLLVTQDFILDKYQDCINYFILKRDKNFLDSLYNKNICSILYNGLNDPYMVNLFDSNQIIISKSIHLFNREMNWSNESNVNPKGGYTNVNVNYNLNIYEIKNELLQLDDNIQESLKKLDNIYNKLFSNNNNLFTKMYNKINDIIDINKLELETRKKEITIIIETIYKLVLGDKQTITNINETFINAVRIISIIYFKVDKLLNDKKIDTVDDLFNENKMYLNEILDVFNLQKDSKESKDIVHIKNIVITYNKIKQILKINENIVERIDELLDEFNGLSKININNIDPYIHSFINDIKESILVLEKCDDESNLIKELNTSIIKLYNDILDDNNIQVYYTRYDEVEGCEKEGCEKEYLKNQINIIEDVLDTSIFDSLNIKWYTYLNMTQITKKLEDIIPLQNSLNEDIKRLEIKIAETETENDDFENIKVLNKDLIKTIENNKKLIDEYKSILEI